MARLGVYRGNVYTHAIRGRKKGVSRWQYKGVVAERQFRGFLLQIEENATFLRESVELLRMIKIFETSEFSRICG